MEDAATAEISRSQIWQWLHHGRVERADVERIIGEVMAELPDEPVYREAREVFEKVSLEEVFVEFLTLTAYAQLLRDECLMSDGTKADDIALALEEAIVSGEIPPGSTLRQEHLSEQFQVSRTPVREALRRLAALGLVTFEPNRGVRVRMLSLDEIREAFMVRAELESLATEIATPKMTDDDLAELERAERRFHRATRGARGDEPRGPPGPRGRARLAPPEPLVPRRDLPRGRRPAHRADGEGGAAHVPREARVGDGSRPRRALPEERPPAPRDPRRDRRAQPARARACSRASTCSRPGACSRRSWTRSSAQSRDVVRGRRLA